MLCHTHTHTLPILRVCQAHDTYRMHTHARMRAGRRLLCGLLPDACAHSVWLKGQDHSALAAHGVSGPGGRCRGPLATAKCMPCYPNSSNGVGGACM